MERPNKKKCYQHDPYNTGLGISTYSKKQDKFIDQLLAERKEANEFIIDIAKLLNIDADGIGFDGLTLSIDDFEEAINKLK